MAIRRFWQRCARELTRESRVESCEAADGNLRSWNPSLGGSRSLSSRRPTLLPEGESRAAFYVASGQIRPSLRRFDPLQQRSLTSADNCRSKFLHRSVASPLSTVSAEDQNVAGNVSTAAVTSVEADAAESEQTVEEFVPNAESTPHTSLVEAIRSQELASAEESSEVVEEILGSNAAVLAPDGGSSRATAPTPLQTDSRREIQPERVYIGGLPFSVKGEELTNKLRELCGQFGVVVHVELAQHRNQSVKSLDMGKHRGFAFLNMENQEQADNVINKLNGTTAFERTITVSNALKKIEPSPAEDRLESKKSGVFRCKVFVGNLHEGTTRLDLLNKYQQYGSIVDLKLITELHSKRSRGFAFITFAEEGQATRAVLDTDATILDGSVLRVNIAKYPQGY